MKHYLLTLCIFLVLTSCHNNKKTGTSKTTSIPEPAIQLDTVSVVANAPVKKEVYRSTNTRTNDLIHTRLEVEFDWTACRMNGKATLQIRPYFYPVSTLYLNARGMDIKKLEVFEVASVKEKKKTGSKTSEETVDIWNRVTSSNFVYENDSLKINLGRKFSSSQTYYVVVDYVAKPNELKSPGGSQAISEDKGLYFINPTGEQTYKMPQIWTQGETQSSSVWFPTIDSPNEKMTQEILMTVDDKFTTLSNGVLVNSEKRADGRRTDHWKLDQPHAPYLAMMAVGEFKKVVDEPWNGKEISYYVEKEYEQYANEIFGDTREMVDFFSRKLGVDYVWPKYAQVVARDYVSGAMENTSATLHGDFMVYQTSREMIDGKKGNGVIAHELFHQWFGDLVTCESWSNLPLNESFATYSEYLWEEYKNGRESADAVLMQSRQGYMMSEKDPNLIRFNYEDKEDMFDAVSYNKGGQILHMLRKAIGDSAFFTGLKLYLETNKFKPVEAHHLRLALEETSGSDLNWFFNQWFFNHGRPKLKITVAKNPGRVELTVEQKQDLNKMPLYRLPLYVDVYTSAGAVRQMIDITEQKQTFTLNTSGEVTLVNFDAERQLLCDLDYKKSREEYSFQYNNAPLYGDRLEALKAVETLVTEPAIYDLFAKAAKNDKAMQLRMFALGKLEKSSPERMPDLKPLLLDIYQQDKNTRVRAKALSVLNKRFAGDADIKQLNESALTEQSYAICGEALSMLAKHDPKLAMQKAKRFEKESGKDVLFPLAALYADHGSDNEVLFFHDAIKLFNGFEMMTFVSYYAKTAKRGNDPASAINTANDLEMIAKGANKFIKFASAKGIKDLYSAWEEREKALQSKQAAGSGPEIEKQIREAADTKAILLKKYESLPK
jgi:aminopeptidase N